MSDKCRKVSKHIWEIKNSGCISYVVRYYNKDLEGYKQEVFSTFEAAQDYMNDLIHIIKVNRLDKAKLSIGWKEYPDNLLEKIGLYDHPNYIDISNNIDERLSWILQNYEGIDARKMNIILMRYKEHKTLEEVGKHYGLTRERVRQIEDVTLNKLKHISNYLIHNPLEIDPREIAFREFESKKSEYIKMFLVDAVQEYLKNFGCPQKTDSWKEYDIAELDLSTRSYRGLKRAGINTVGQALLLDAFKLSKIRNLGKKSIKEILSKTSKILKKGDINL